MKLMQQCTKQYAMFYSTLDYLLIISQVLIRKDKNEAEKMQMKAFLVHNY